jgi:hypothetical protein
MEDRSREREREFQGGRLDRVVGNRTPTIRTEDLHYNPTYGTTLVDAQAKALDKNQSDFLSSINKANTELTTSRGALDTKYQGALGIINSEQQKISDLVGRYSSIPDFETWYAKTNPPSGPTFIGSAPNAVGERGDGYADYSSNPEGYGVWVPTTPESHPDMYTQGSGYWEQPEGGTPYWVDTTVETKNKFRTQYNEEFKSKSPEFNEWYTTSFLPEKTVPFRIEREGSTYGVYNLLPQDAAKFSEALNNTEGYHNVYPDGNGGYIAYVAKKSNAVTSALDDYKFQMESALIDSYLGEVKSTDPSSHFSDYRSTLETDYSNANALLSQRQKEIEAAQRQNTEGLTLIRTKYQEKLGNIKDTIGALVYGNK